MKTAEILAVERNDLHVVMFGNESDDTKALALPYTTLGHIDEEWKLAVGYSAADLTLLPSLEDNLPNVILESMSCGTPVLAFDNGGCAELIIDGVNGQGSEPTPECMARFVNKYLDKDIRDGTRAFAIKYFPLDVIAKNYIAI